MYVKFSHYLVLISSTLLQLLPIFFVTGPAIPDIVISSISVFFLFFLFYKNFFYLFKNYIIYFLLIIFVYLNLNSLFSEYPLVSFKYSIGFLRVIIFTAVISYLSQVNTSLVRNFCYCFFACIFFLFFDSLLQFFTGSNILGYKPLTSSRMTSFFNEEQIMGSYVSRMLPLVIGLSYIFIKNIRLIFLLILLSAIIIFLSGERTSLAFCMITLFGFFLIEQNIKNTIIATLIVFISFACITFFNKSQFDRIVTHTINQSKSSKYGLYSYRHQLHYQTAYKMFLDRPLLGQGLGTFRHLCMNEKFSMNKEIVEKGKRYASRSAYYFFESEFDIIDKIYFIKIFSHTENKKSSTNITESHLILQEKNRFSLRLKPNNVLYFKSGDYLTKGQLLYSDFEYKNGCNTHPHNIYMQFLSELGIIGFGIFSIIFLYVVLKIFSLIKLIIIKKNKNSCLKARFFILLSVFISMFPLLPSGNYFGNWLLLISYLPFGFYLYMKQINVFKSNDNI